MELYFFDRPLIFTVYFAPNYVWSDLTDNRVLNDKNSFLRQFSLSNKKRDIIRWKTKEGRIFFFDVRYNVFPGILTTDYRF